jgi:hypothetical protein
MMVIQMMYCSCGVGDISGDDSDDDGGDNVMVVTMMMDRNQL